MHRTDTQSCWGLLLLTSPQGKAAPLQVKLVKAAGAGDLVGAGLLSPLQTMLGTEAMPSSGSCLQREITSAFFQVHSLSPTLAH